MYYFGNCFKIFLYLIIEHEHLLMSLKIILLPDFK